MLNQKTLSKRYGTFRKRYGRVLASGKTVCFGAAYAYAVGAVFRCTTTFISLDLFVKMKQICEVDS